MENCIKCSDCISLFLGCYSHDNIITFPIVATEEGLYTIRLYYMGVIKEFTVELLAGENVYISKDDNIDWLNEDYLYHLEVYDTDCEVLYYEEKCYFSFKTIINTSNYAESFTSNPYCLQS